jgi:hypothetical protein
MCLSCAIPVRGRTLGAECLTAALGPDAPIPEIVEREAGAFSRTVARAAFALAVLATLLPWSRFGIGAEPMGAWARAPNWSMLAALSSVAGLGTVLGRRLTAGHDRVWDAVSAVAGGLVAVGSALALVRPPDFTSPWIGPWVALVAGIGAAGASIAAYRLARPREPLHV